MDQRQSDYTIRDLVQSLHGAAERFFELIAPALEQYESIASEIKITLPDGLGVTDSPAEPEIEQIRSDVGLSPVHENWIHLDRDVTDILRVALPAEHQSMQLYTIARLIMDKIEQYLRESK